MSTKFPNHHMFYGFTEEEQDTFLYWVKDYVEDTGCEDGLNYRAHKEGIQLIREKVSLPKRVTDRELHFFIDAYLTVRAGWQNSDEEMIEDMDDLKRNVEARTSRCGNRTRRFFRRNGRSNETLNHLK